MKKWFVFFLTLIFSLPSFADGDPALVLDSIRGQTLQIQTHFRSVFGSPTWLLIIREVQTGRILPYQFDIEKNNNFWVALTAGRFYQVTVSELTFGPYAVIKNFCHLQNGIISGKSMWIVLSGDLTPNRWQHQCRISKYRD